MPEGVSPSPLLSFLWLRLHVVTTEINRSMAHRQLIMQRRQQAHCFNYWTTVSARWDVYVLLLEPGGAGHQCLWCPRTNIYSSPCLFDGFVVRVHEDATSLLAQLFLCFTRPAALVHTVSKMSTSLQYMVHDIRYGHHHNGRRRRKCEPQKSTSDRALES
jgi:hypothetical protein